jgi:hypothetical protein
MENQGVIERISFLVINQYINNLIKSNINKLTLFPVFSYTGSPNLSCPVSFIIVDKLDILLNLGGSYSNN